MLQMQAGVWQPAALKGKPDMAVQLYKCYTAAYGYAHRPEKHNTWIEKWSMA